jgi:hypothetical protein
MAPNNMSITLYVVLAAFALATSFVFYASLRQRRLRAASEQALVQTYSSLSHPPRMEISSSFGYPVFKVLFRNQLLLQSAEDSGLNESFIRAIGELYKDHGRRGNQFDARLAVSFAHEGILTRADIGIQ